MDIYDEAIMKWGKELQVIMAIEEMAELTKALVKSLRGKGINSDIIEEMADVQIMLIQLRRIFGDTAYIEGQKLLRLRGMIDGA